LGEKEIAYRNSLKEKQTIVIKIGTSSLTFPNGRLNLARIQQLVKVVCKLRQMEKSVVLVSSGSIAVGVGKMGKSERPSELPGKQAAAAVGQAVLIKMYQKFFNHRNQHIAQILLTNDVMEESKKYNNVRNTFLALLEMGVVTIVNENDTVATEEIVYGDNDTLSAVVATICDADLLVLLSDIDGMYTADPKKDPNAVRRSIIESIDDDVVGSASGAGSNFGTGGMITKVRAAQICFEKGIDTIVANAQHPEILFDLLEGKDIGTLFVAPK